MSGIENVTKSDEAENLSLGQSIGIKYWEIEKTKIENSDVYNSQENLRKTGLDEKLDQPIVFAPRPTIELAAAAIKLQKVYKSYRTRRNLADCAVVVEELWWQALDFAALKRSSFFDVKRHESASSRWGRAMTRAAKVGKGLSKDENAQKLALQHWLEAIDPRHRYGHNLHFYYDVWFDSKSSQPFFYWLDVGDGKEVNIINSPRVELHCQCIEYLGPSERKAYEVIVESGKLVYMQNKMPVNTIEDSKWIFVLSTSRALYVGRKKKGMFQHSSFLSGGAITAAGRLVAHDGILEAIWPYSGHYLPTEENFKEFLIFLEENHIDLSNVKRCAADDTCESPTSSSALNRKFVNDNETIISSCQEEETTRANAVDQATVFDTVKPLSCKWTSGVGPRIGCVREYPSQLQIKALEHVKLSPSITVDAAVKCVPIPTPRPIPKIRVSPRLAYMGLPTPMVPITYVI